MKVWLGKKEQRNGFDYMVDSFGTMARVHVTKVVVNTPLYGLIRQLLYSETTTPTP